jgi:hypothetical protein
MLELRARRWSRMAVVATALGVLSACQAPSPKVSEASNVHIRLTRGVCFGWCPAYAIDIAGDGAVTYEGFSSVAVSGRFQDRIAPAEVAALVGLFERTDFFSLKDEYIGEITDSPFYSVSLTIDGRTKKVIDYVGKMAGMPEAVTELEDAIDRTAGMAKFVKGTPETIDVLRKAGFDFSSPQAGVYLADALEIGSHAYARSLIEAGAPLDGRTTRNQQSFVGLLNGSRPESRATAQLLVEAAIARGSRRDRTDALWLAMGLDDAGLLRRLIARGADVRTTFPDYRWITLLSDAQSGEVVRVLLSAGLDPNGVMPGAPPLLSVGSEDAALALLQGGANPNARSPEGVSIRDRAREKGWTRILARLGA